MYILYVKSITFTLR